MNINHNLLPDALIEQAKSNVVSVVSKYVALEKQGKEYRGLCPFHSERTPSFSVVPEKNFYYCFGCGASGSPIDFVSSFENIPFREAVQRITGEMPAGDVTPITRASVKKDEKPEWMPIVPVPADCSLKPRDIFNRRKGDGFERMTVSRRWEYRDASGGLIGYICRFDLPGGGKDVIPQSYCVNTKTSETSWRWLSFDKPRPIYGLDVLAANPGAAVIVAEGEKACDAARGLLAGFGVPMSKLLVVSWPGGGKAVDFVDWSPLAGRAVALWPDADQKPYPDGHPLAGERMPALEQPGMKCMLAIAEKLDGVAAGVKLVVPPEGVADGWDLADELPEGFNLLQHTKNSAKNIAEIRKELLLATDQALTASKTTLSTSCNTDTPSGRNEVRRRRQQEENDRLQEPMVGIMFPSKLTVQEMHRTLIWIAEGEQVAYVSEHYTLFLSYKEMRSLTAESTTYEPSEGTKKPIANAKLWQSSPGRREVMTRTFHAGADVICTDPDGKRAVNTWRPIKRWAAESSIALFLEHIEYLFADVTERNAFLDWLAHLEQKPGELPHYGWLHVARHTGCGRNWLASVLARVWRGHVAPNVDLPALLDSNYNGSLSGRVLAIVDEVQEGAGENSYRHINKLRSLVNAEYRDINPKFGRQYREHNACRWLVFSNHENALPIDDHDRRWRVIMHREAPRSPDAYNRLYEALDDPEFINAVAMFLAMRDISHFNPGERPPMNQAKLSVIGAAKSFTQQLAEEIVAHWPADIITNSDIAFILSEGATTNITALMRRALETLDCISICRQIKIEGKGQRTWIIRNHANWQSQDIAAIKAECLSARGPACAGWDAALVLAERRNVE